MADDPFLGRVIADKYVVESFIGGGSMGAVYKARQTALHRVVAIKVMYPELAKDREFVARFRREAHAASRLAHTNSITITDFGEESDGLLYLVMEFVDGPSLEDLIENGEPLPEERIVDIMSQILSALAAAHDAGIVHRDLKPANVLVVQKFDDDGRPIDHVKVCDFGVASLKDVTEAVLRPSQDGLGAVTQAYAEAARRQVPRPAARQLTMAGAVVGTPAYMSSEQASGKPQDARSDLYSLGVVMFEMLTRRLPFDGHSAEELMARHIAAPVPAPIDIVPCNARLSDACVRAMQKDPSDRYPNARAMRADIRGALALGSLGSLGEGLTAYPPSGGLPHASNSYS
ncbi:MAG: serine/threonine protein kinase, partial [Proteobacteria bacterium]